MKKRASWLAALALSAALLSGQVSTVLAENSKRVETSALIPGTITVAEPTRLADISLPSSEYGKLRWADGERKADQYSQSFEVVFEPADGVDLSYLSSWDSDKHAVTGTVKVIVESLKAPEESASVDIVPAEETAAPAEETVPVEEAAPEVTPTEAPDAEQTAAAEQQTSETTPTEETTPAEENTQTETLAEEAAPTEAPAENAEEIPAETPAQETAPAEETNAEETDDTDISNDDAAPAEKPASAEESQTEETPAQETPSEESLAEDQPSAAEEEPEVMLASLYSSNGMGIAGSNTVIGGDIINHVYATPTPAPDSATPTAAPTATPTAAPTPTKVPDVATPTPRPTKAPTAAAENTQPTTPANAENSGSDSQNAASGNSASSTENQPTKVTPTAAPQNGRAVATGDNTPIAGFGLLSVAAALLAALALALKKKSF